MKTFQVTLEKLGRSGNDEDGWSLEIDDTAIIWSHTKKFGGIMKAIKWVANTHPKLFIDKKNPNHDKINPYFYRVNIATECGHYENSVGLDFDSVGMVFLEVREIRYTDNDEIYGEPMQYYDGEWQT